MAYEDRIIGADIVVDKYHAPIDANYSMNVRDYVLRPRALTQDITITLPPVVEARGKFYSVIADDLGNAAAVGLNWVTITHDNDSADWEADVILKEKGRGHVFYSDGLKWALEPFGDMTFDSMQTVGNINLREINLTVSAIGTGTVNIEAFRASITSGVKSGAWANAIVGKIDYATGGAAHGMAAVICADMIPPNDSLERGSLYCMDFAMGPGALSSWGSAGPVAFMNFQNYNDQTYFDDNAYWFRLARVLEGAGQMLSVNAHTLKVLIDGSVLGKERYVVLSESENILDHSTNVVSGSFGLRSQGIVTDGASEGGAAYLECNVLGTPTGHIMALGAWININAAPGAFDMRACDFGVWTGVDLSNAKVINVSMQMHLGGGGAPLHSYQFEFNHSGHALTGLFFAVNEAAVSYTAGSYPGAIVGKIMVNIAGQPLYIALYN